MQVVQYTWVTLRTAKITDMESTFMMAQNTRATGKTTKKMVTESTFIMMAQNTRVNYKDGE